MAEKNKINLKSVYDRLKSLEARVAELEARISEVSYRKDYEESLPEQRGKAATPDEEQVSLEFQIGEYWLAQVGAVLLMLGIAFLISYPIPSLPSFLAILIGYIAIAFLYWLAHYWRNTFQYLSRITSGGSLILLYFATVRLHFFNASPLITNKILGLFVIVIILTFNTYLAGIRGRKVLACFVLLLFYSTAIISDSPHFTLWFLVIPSVLSVFFHIKYKWNPIVVISLIMSYSVHVLWLFNNPLLGHRLQAIADHHFNLIYMLLYASVYFYADLSNREKSNEIYYILLGIMNGLGIYVIGGLNILSFFKAQISLMAFLAFAYFIIISVLKWHRFKEAHTISVHASFANLALSIAIFSQFKYPDYFIWLALQSVFVIIIALWYRSRIIVLANILIYVIIFAVYLAFAPSHDLINLSYAVSALSSARILNWKKGRLKLKTDFIRNAYLSCAFIIVLFGLYKALPGNFVSLSWLGAALFYFFVSLLLNNIKYRWMAILTIFATVARVLVIDMARLDAGFRIILFLAVGIGILILSWFYNKYSKKMNPS